MSKLSARRRKRRTCKRGPSNRHLSGRTACSEVLAKAYERPRLQVTTRVGGTAKARACHRIAELLRNNTTYRDLSRPQRRNRHRGTRRATTRRLCAKSASSTAWEGGKGRHNVDRPGPRRRGLPLGMAGATHTIKIRRKCPRCTATCPTGTVPNRYSTSCRQHRESLKRSPRPYYFSNGRSPPASGACVRSATAGGNTRGLHIVATLVQVRQQKMAEISL